MMGKLRKWLPWTRTRSRKASLPATVSSPLTIAPTDEYRSHYSDDEIDEIARANGGATMNDSDVWGPNADTIWPIHEINAGFGVAAHLIGHRLREGLATIYGKVELAVVIAHDAGASALEAVDEYGYRQIELEELRQRIKDAGLGFPHWIAHSLLYSIALGGLVIGDLAFIAVAFQLFGLSDEKLLGFLPLVDELHLAASASVGALIVLAHVAGKQLRLIWFDLERLRHAKTDEERSKLPGPSRFSIAIAVVSILAAGALLAGIADVRAGYLAAQGIDSRTASFAAVQGGVFVAALALAFLHAHPFGREWVDLGRRARAGAREMEQRSQMFVTAVATVNDLVDRGNAMIAAAAHHLGAARFDVIRQAARFAWVSQIHSPEPVSSNALMPESLPQPTDRSADESAAFLLGPTGLPEIRRMTTDPVVSHREKVRLRIARLRDAWVGRAFDGEPAEAEATVTIGDEEVSVPAPPAGAATGNGGGAHS